MTKPGEQRKLAAIMFTDMVGYSALSQRDDKLALELLEEHREILRKIFPKFNGTEIKTIGDAFLVEFQSALEAAECGIAIQRTLAHRNADAPSDRQIQVKIGIHIGDVVHRAGDVYGDGVNIASRIEPLAGAGGICVSMDVERQIRNAVETRFEKLAPTELKNISVAMDLFRIVLPWEIQSEIRSELSTARASFRPDGQQSAIDKAPATSARFPWHEIVIGILLLAALIGGAFLWLHRDTSSRNTAATAPSSASSTIPEKSIAVLPFENLSDDKSNAYFAEGIQDEILTRLAKIAALKVISRSSTQKYKSAPDNLREVGKQLGVANLLEGSVQKIANTVKVNVQLIRARTDEHLWAESYNRKLDDVFAVEGEVANAIAEQLNAKLSGAEAKAVSEKPTQNAAAYDAYLRGIAIDGTGTVETSKGAAAAYAEAVRLDPNFGLAWARLAMARSHLYFNGVDRSVNSAGAVKEAADQAMTLAPNAGETWIAQGIYRYRVLRDYNAALQSYAEAVNRLPNSSLVLEQMAHVERRQGQWEQAVQHYQAAAQLDPRSIDVLSNLSDALQSLRRFKEAEVVIDRMSEVSPGSESVLAARIGFFQNDGRLKEAGEVLSKAPPNSQNDGLALQKILQLFYERKFDAAIKQTQENTPPSTANDVRTLTLLAFCQKHAGKEDDARATFQRVVALIKPEETTVDARVLPSFLAWAYAGLGEKEKALDEAKKAVAMYKDDALSKAFTEQVLAEVQAMFGDFDPAIATLAHLLEAPNGSTRGQVRIDPFWDPLRKDPRFQKLIEEPK